MYGDQYMLMYGNYSVLFHTCIFIANRQLNVYTVCMCNNGIFLRNNFFFTNENFFYFMIFFITEKFYFNYLNINTVLFFYLTNKIFTFFI
jgi:hypothetical protein